MNESKTEFIGMKFDGVLHHLGAHETYDDANEAHRLDSYAWIWSRDGLEHLISMGKSILEEQMTHKEPLPEIPHARFDRVMNNLMRDLPELTNAQILAIAEVISPIPEEDRKMSDDELMNALGI